MRTGRWTDEHKTRWNLFGGEKDSALRRMQTEIEEFLRKHAPRTFKASEVAEVMKLSRPSAQRQLKKLASKGRVEVKDGRYGVPGSAPKAEVELQSRISEMSDLTGFRRETIVAWIEGEKSRKKRSLPDAEGSRE